MMTSQLKMKTGLIGLCFSALGILLISSGCAEVAGSGANVNIPFVRVQCTTGACNANTSKIAYVVYTTSGCNAPDFGAVASGSATVSCTIAAGCSGTVNQFVDSSSSTVTSIRDGFYSVCATIAMSPYTGTPQSGDMLGVLSSTSINGGSTQQTVTNFTTKP